MACSPGEETSRSTDGAGDLSGASHKISCTNRLPDESAALGELESLCLRLGGNSNTPSVGGHRSDDRLEQQHVRSVLEVEPNPPGRHWSDAGVEGLVKLSAVAQGLDNPLTCSPVPLLQCRWWRAAGETILTGRHERLASGRQEFVRAVGQRYRPFCVWAHREARDPQERRFLLHTARVCNDKSCGIDQVQHCQVRYRVNQAHPAKTTGKVPLLQ